MKTTVTSCLIILAMAVAACSDAEGDNSPAATSTTAPASVISAGLTTTSPGLTTTSEAPTTTSADVVVVRPTALLRGIMTTLERPGAIAVRGIVTSATDSGVSIEVMEVLSDPDERFPGDLTDDATFVTSTNPRKAERLTETIDATGAGLPALVAVGADGIIDRIILLDPSMTRFPRGVGPGSSTLYFSSRILAAGIDEGRVRARLLPAVEPDRASWCQSTELKWLTFESTSGDEVADLLAFGRAMSASNRHAEVERELEATAAAIANDAQFVDVVTGEFTHGYATDVVDQVRRGTPIDEVEVHPTVPVLVSPGNLDWGTSGGLVVVFGEAGTDRLLGWMSETGRGIVEVMVPPSGADVELYLRVMRPGFECLERAGAPDLVIPFDAIAGAERAEINLGALTYKPMG